MSRILKMTLCLLLVAAVCLPMLPVSGRAAAEFTTVGGWNETIFATISGVTDEQVTAVSYSGTTSGSLSGEDFTYLVRSSGDGVRIDIPGLKAGTYSLTVTTSAGTYSASGIAVAEQDRSGYAHFNYTEGIGAYNDDGTVKANTVIVYVTNENKDTVTVKSKDGTTVSGIGNILNSAGAVGSSRGATNTNSGILKKLAEDGTPLLVRIIGNVTAPVGLTAWGSIDYGGGTDDNGSLARMQNCRDITVEGIGTDATCNGWGFSIDSKSRNTAAGLGMSFEFRNLTFKNVPEDCIGLAGDADNNNVVTDPIQRCWVHNCAFYGPSGIKDASKDQDKGEGDGAFDFKRGQYCTLSYCYFEGYHKTSLVGGGDNDQQYHITWHHNYWKDCESRGPLGRQANMHLYNNVIEGQSSYCMSLRANLYIFAEYCTYIDSKNVVDSNAGGVVKSYNNKFVNCTGTNRSHLVIVTDKSTQVTSANPYANFENDSTLSYIPSGDYLLQTDMDAAYANVIANAGPQKKPKSPTDGEEMTYTFRATTDVAPGTDSSAVEESSYADGYLTVMGNVIRRGDANSVTSIQFAKQAGGGFRFTVTGTATVCVQFSSTGSSNTSALGIRDLDGELVAGDDGTTIYTTTGASSGKKTVTYTLDAGTYTILCPVTGDSDIDGRGARIYTVDITETLAAHTHSYTSEVTKEGSCVVAKEITYTCSCGDSYIETVKAPGHKYVQTVTAPGCTQQGYTTYTCSVCGSYFRSKFVAATGHNYVDGVCANCGEADPDAAPALFNVAGVNLALNNDITLYLYLMAENYDSGYTMEIVKSYADGSSVTKTVAATDWESYYGTMYRVGFNGIAAKEMTDEITVTVYDASGNAVSNEFVTTVADAAVLVYKSEANAASFTMMADLLNYGAAAQGNFRYNTDDLANTRLTAEQAAYASARFDMSTVTGKASGTAGAMGATLYLDTNIQHNFIFDAAVVDSTMTAKVSYTDYKGNAKSFTIPGSLFVKNGSMITVNVSALTPADVNVPVTVQIVDANGAAVCSLTDSIAWYCVRAQASATNNLFIELMEFATSCNAYFG